MNIHIHDAAVTYTRDGVARTLKHRTGEQAKSAVRAIRACDEHRGMTIGQFYALWKRAHAGPCLSKNSQRSYDSTFRRHIRPTLGHLPVASLDDGTIRIFIDALADEAGCYRKATPTVLRLQALLNKAVQWGLIDENPVFRIDALFLGGKPEGLDDAA